MATTHARRDAAPTEPTHWERARTWRGRSGRLEYALVLATSTVALIVGVVLLSSPFLSPAGTPAAFAWIAVCMYVSVCAVVRRIHDLDWPTLMVCLAGCVPGLNIVIGLALLLLPSHPSTTAHGPIPASRIR